MAGKFFISKQYPMRIKFEKNQIKKIIKEILINDMNLPLGLYYNNVICQGKIKSRSLFHTRCRFTGRAKANFNKFKMSRMIFKRKSEFGLLNGVKKASW
jgi:small subunit ribosomal protein S14